MNVDDFKKVLSRREPPRRSLVVGSLLREDPSEAPVRDAVVFLKNVVDAYPQYFRSRKDLHEWVNDAEKAAVLAGARIASNSPSPSQIEEFKKIHQQAIGRLNDPVWDAQTGRHEYRHTLSSCDDADPLPRDVAKRFSALEHLCLWSFGSLAALPDLPTTLKTLDLRNAWALPSLPSLPATLETLDLSGCRSLRSLPQQPLPNVKRLYLRGCNALTQHELEAFWRVAGCAAVIEEIEVHDSAWLHDLTFLDSACPRLRVLRASDCPNLDALPHWASWRELEHLDLRGDVRIKTLPSLPSENLRYLGLHGCDGLRDYLGQDLNERDLGVKREDNAADNFRLRTRLGRNTREHPRCKLLLLGNGRGGKTTLAKALQWREMDDVARRAQPELEPKGDEDVSHAIQQWDWTTELPNPSPTGEPPALIRIWDFGGQETYHGTHRVFAASGALYILVLREGNADPRDPKGQIPDPDWRQFNRRRPAEYWLDYIQDLDRTHGGRAEARARVLLVHTAHAGGAAKHALADGLSERYPGLVAGEWWIGALPDEWGASQFEREFRSALKAELRRQVREEGIRVPRFFLDVAEEIQRRSAGVTTMNDADAVLSWRAWIELLDGCMARGGGGPGTLDRRDAEAVARMLHQSGDIFWLHGHDRSILLNQRVALKEIYRLLDFRETRLSAFRKEVKDHYGLLDGRVLREGWWAGFSPQVQSQLIEFMGLCQICVPVFKLGSAGVVGEWLLALDPTLLPQYAAIEGDLKGLFDSAGFEIEDKSWELLAHEGRARPFSESGFRAMQAWAVRQIENRVHVWCNGVQHTQPERRVGFSMTWVGANGDADAYAGSLRVRYWTSSDGEGESASLSALKQWVMGPGSPYPAEEWGQALVGTTASIPGRRDIGITVRAAQAPDAQGLANVLKASTGEDRQPLNVFLYTSESQPTLDATYDAIRKARIQLLWISQEYLDPDPSNRVTLHEFANAIFTWARARGTAVDHVHLNDLPAKGDQRVVLVYQNNGSFDFLQHFWDRAHTALESMADHHNQRVVDLARAGKDTVRESKHTQKFRAAAQLSKAFCTFYVGEMRNQSLLLSEAPKDPEERKALAARLVRLLAEPAAGADRS